MRPFSDWTGDTVAAELIPVSETRAYTRVYDPELGPTEPVYYWDFAYADAWRWGIVNPTTNDAAEMLDEAPSYGRVDQSTVNGETWTFEYADADARSRVAALRPNGIVRGASFAGFIDGIVALDARK